MLGPRLDVDTATVRAATLPQLFSEVWGQRREQQQQDPDRLLPEFAANPLTLTAQLIPKGHQRGDGGVESEVLEVARHLLDRLVQGAADLLLGIGLSGLFRIFLQGQRPHRSQEA